MKNISFTLLLLSIVPIAAVVGGFWMLRLFGFNLTTGDPFNLVSAWVSALAFGAVLVSIRQQSTELEMQREELKLQREELHATLEENRKMAAAQTETEERLFLSAYVSAVDCLRDLNSNPINADLFSPPAAMVSAAQLRIIRRKLERLTESLDARATRLFPYIGQATKDEQVLQILSNAVSSFSHAREVSRDARVIDHFLVARIANIANTFSDDAIFQCETIRESMQSFQKEISIMHDAARKDVSDESLQQFWKSIVNIDSDLDQMLISMIQKA